MANYKVRSEGKLQVIETWKAVGAQTSKEFSFPGINFDDVSKLILEIDGASTGTLILRLQINDDTTTNYFTDGRTIIAGTEAFIDVNSAVGIQIVSAVGVDAFFGQIEINIPLAHSNDYPLCNLHFTSPNGTTVVTTGYLAVVQTDINKLKILVSTSSMRSQTRITLYKLLR